MQHEYAHVRTAEKYGLDPIYAPSLKTFFGLNFHPAPLDSTKFSLEDQDKIKNMSLEMKESIVLAGINSDMRFMSVFAVISMVLLISASSFYYWAYKKNSYKLFIAGMVCSYLLLLLLCWIFWAVDGVLLHNINNPGADVHRLI
ncbi:MAG: hypothetical protein NTW67_04960, partial [Candidatus Woesearchaeota archaeon]|nr:hypothetical protein [Candidatus Woesearchaeota archaeon]